MGEVLEQHTFHEFREDPKGMLRYGAKPQLLNGDLLSVYTVACRTGKDRPWWATTAGSVSQVKVSTWSEWQLVEDPLK